MTNYVIGGLILNPKIHLTISAVGGSGQLGQLRALYKKMEIYIYIYIYNCQGFLYVQ
jgi:hypothetical protein